MLWLAEPNGQYTTKSAYRLCMNTSSLNSDGKIFKTIWQLKIPPWAVVFWLSILVQPPNISRKEMLVKNLAGNLCMVMFFGLLAVWLFFQLLLVQVLSLHCWFFLSSCWLLLGCCMLGKSISLNWPVILLWIMLLLMKCDCLQNGLKCYMCILFSAYTFQLSLNAPFL